MLSKITKKITRFFAKNKHSKKFWGLLSFNVLSYLTVPSFGLFVSLLWWFFATKRASNKIKKILSFSSLGLILLVFSSLTLAYKNDPEPTLELRGIKNNQIIKAPSFDLSGKFDPTNFSVYINNEKINTNEGSFTYTYSLELGENKIKIKVSNFKSVEQEILIMRELSDEEIAQQEAEQKENEEKQKENTENPQKESEQKQDEVPEQNHVTEVAQNLFLVTRVIDGDTLEIEGEKRVRLIGINTPESGDCYFHEAKNKLSELVLNKRVRLEKDISETDRYQRLLRYIYIGDVFVNDYLVAEGYANTSSYPPDVKHQNLFRASENQARNQNKGLWSGCSPGADAPTQTTSNTSSQTVVEPATQNTGDCVIKGNISHSTGEKIYHVPGQRDYEKTVIDTNQGERWFCSESEAQAAGWRKAKR